MAWYNNLSRKLDNSIEGVPGLGSVYTGSKDVMRDVPIWNKLHGLKSSEEQAAELLNQGLDSAKSGIQSGYQTAGGYYDPYMSMAEGLPALQQRIQSGEFRSQAPNMANFNYQQSPGYQFQMDEGLGQVQRAMGARGLSESGAERKGMARFSQGLANQDYNQDRDRYFNEQMGLSGLQNQFNQQQLQNELGMGQIGMGAISQRAGIDMGLAELLAQLDVGKSQAGAASKIARAKNTRDMLNQLVQGAATAGAGA